MMELAIQKKHINSHQKSKQGGWFSKSKLENQESYTKRLSIMERNPPVLVRPQGYGQQSLALGKAEQPDSDEPDSRGGGDLHHDFRDL